MNEPRETVQGRFAAIVMALSTEARVTAGEGKRGFGSAALKVDGKIFAMISSKEKFVVKLPRARVDSLVAAGVGERFDPGHGRLMKEWLALEPASEADWLALATEALEFVGRRSRTERS